MTAARTGTTGMGDTQRVVLRLLEERRGWWAGCGWLWGSPSETERIMKSLVRRGLATVEVRQGRGNVYQPVGGVEA